MGSFRLLDYCLTSLIFHVFHVAQFKSNNGLRIWFGKLWSFFVTDNLSMNVDLNSVVNLGFERGSLHKRKFFINTILQILYDIAIFFIALTIVLYLM